MSRVVMPLVFACLAPHGGGLVPRLGEDRGPGWPRLRAALTEAAGWLRRRGPEVVLLATPHGAPEARAVTLLEGTAARGEVAGRLTGELPLDRGLTVQLASRARRLGLPVGLRDAGTSSLDWGALIPWALLGPWPAAVVALVGADVPREALQAFGRLVAAAWPRTAVVASGDLSHVHDPRGPYGGARDAAQACDEAVLAAVARGEPEAAGALDADLVRRAKPDAIPPLLVLAGALRAAGPGDPPLALRLLAYAVPTYFGMAVAAYA